MASVGEILASERRRQGKSVTDVVDGTKIRSRLIDALEGDRWEQLPSPAYVKGYIQSYARLLEIPAEPLLEQFNKEMSTREKTPRSTDRFLGVGGESLVPERDKQHAIPREVWVATASAVVIVLLLICGLSRLLGVGDTPETSPLPSASPGAPASEPTGSAAIASTTTVDRVPSGFKLRVTVKAGRASWVSARIDGLQAYAGSLQSGESREFVVNDTAILRVGKPNSVVVTRDGGAVVLPASPGVAQVTLKANQ